MILVGGRLRNNPNGWFGMDPGFGLDEWKEAVAMYSPTQFAMGRKRSHATLTGYIPFGRLAGCLKFMLGYSWVDADGFLRREPPAAHPWFPTLYATELLECRGVKFINKAAAIHPLSLPYAKYTLAQVTVAYSQPPYQILLDSDLVGHGIDINQYRGQELRRHCYWNPQPRTEMLELPGGMLVFDGGPADGRPFLAPRNVYPINKSLRTLIWSNVPEEFTHSPFGFAKKLETYIGCINDRPFLADPNTPNGEDGGKYTWLLDSVSSVNNEMYVDPIASAAFEGLTRRTDYQFHFVHFNPERGNPGNEAAGWRLNIQADGKWWPGQYSYQIFGVGIKAPQDIPKAVDFNKLFTVWNDA